MARPEFLLCASTILILSAFAAPAQSGVSPDLKSAIDSVLDRRVASDSFSGTVLVARNGKIIYQHAAGLANKASGAPMRLDTRLQIASMTKLFTQIAVRQLEQAGKLALSDTVGKFLPQYPNAVVRSRVTVEQLLRHRSGIGSFWNQRFLEEHAQVRSVQDYLKLFDNDSLLFEPGTSEAYSNGGYVVLGAIIEAVSGKSYQDYVRENIFRPAGMANTVPFDSRINLANAAVGYTTQMLGGPVGPDRRLAGVGPRPGTKRAADSTPPSNGRTRLRIIGPDGRQLSDEEARAAVRERSAGGQPRMANTGFQPGMSGPAGDHYSTVGDLLKLASALVSHRLLDSARTVAALGAKYAAGGEFRANGGGPGVNSEFSIYPSGDVMAVLSNYDPPAATAVAEYVRSLLAPANAPTGGSSNSH